MMMAPEQYAEQFENATYQEILKVKNELISDIMKFEHDYDMEDPDWYVCPKPDVRYQWNLKALGLITPMLAEAFNREYEWGGEGYGGLWWGDEGVFWGVGKLGKKNIL